MNFLPSLRTMPPVAIVGIGCRFPGAHGPEEFWQLLKDGVDAITEVPGSRWNIDECFDADPDAPGKMSTRYGGFVDGVDRFDNGFFSVSPREAASIDPQQRLALETVWETLEDAAIDPVRLRGSNTGVFFGLSNVDYSRLAVRTAEDIGPHIGTGGAFSIAANRISYAFDFKGPSLAVDTACSSSLVAVHLACRSLNAWECDLALAGGANLILLPDLTIAFSKARMMAADGRCKAFDARADGYVRGEGVGFVALKRLVDAVDDGDPIVAVICGTAVNQDGLTNGLTAPNPASQAEVVDMACRAAQVSGASVDYVECHGTGTALGDPIEVEGLARTFARNRDPDTPLRIGSVKTNIGHLEAAAGIAGLIKVSLALKNEMFPASLHFEQPNPRIPFDRLPIIVQTEPAAWARDGKVRRAGVSSFGFGGTNAHVIVDEASENAELAPGNTDRPLHIVTLSAKSADRLAALAERHSGWLCRHPETALADYAYTCNTGRARLPVGLTVVGADIDAIARQLADMAAKPAGLVRRPSRGKPKIAFMFSGQGAQRAGMARALYDGEPRFRAVVDRCLDSAPVALRGDLEACLLDDGFRSERINRTELAQPALFIFESALATLWQTWGIAPDLVLGHSVGEIAAVCAAGGMTLESGLEFSVARGALMQKLPAGGAMIAVDLCEDRLRELAGDAMGELDIAAYNGPDQIVLSGTSDDVETIAGRLEKAGVACRRLAVSHAFHSALMSPALAGIEAAAADIGAAPLTLPFIANVDGRMIDVGERIGTGYWHHQARSPVRFRDTVENAVAAGCTIFIEVGPKPVLCGLGRRMDADGQAQWLASMAPDGDCWRTILKSLGQAWQSGVNVDWGTFDEPWPRRRMNVPTYPFEATRHWCCDTPATPSVASLQATAKSTAEEPRKETAADGQDILTRLRAHVASALWTEIGNIDPDAPFAEMGADSVTMVELVMWVEREFGHRLPANRLGTDLVTLRNVVEFIEMQPLGEAGQESRAASPQPTRDESPATVSDAADDDATSGVAVIDLGGLIGRYNAMTATSKATAERYRQVMADRRAVAGFRPSIKELVYPIIGQRAEGAHMWDVDDNRYVDLTMGFGVHLFGHNPGFIREALHQQIDAGFQLGPQAEFAGQVAEKIARMANVDRVAFANSGTEAVMTAIRLARAATGRDKIVMFLGAYHGHFDGTLAIPDGGAVNNASRPMAIGTPQSAVADTIVLPYGDSRALDTIRARRDEIAAVLVEPVQSRRPELQPADFLRDLRDLTHEAGIALVFDEMITGFRTHPGGAQALFAVAADITTYGKLLGGGLPIGVIAGRGLWLDGMDGGAWHFGDDSKPDTALPFFAGTFNKNPLSIAAANAVLDELETQGPDLQTDLNARTAVLLRAINAALETEKAPLRAAGFASFFRFVHRANLDAFYYGLIEKGVYVWEGRTCFVSTAHARDDFDRIVDAVAASARELAGYGSCTAVRTSPDVPASTTASDKCANEVNLEVRLATSVAEVSAVQALRYRVFHQEMGAADESDRSGEQRDADRFDEVCDHLIVIDRTTDAVIGTYRLIGPEAARACGRFYSEDEYDVSCFKRPGDNVLELGRACVDPAYRSGAVMQLLWQGIADYAAAHDIDTMFGCASFPGTDPAAHAESLSYLYHNHLAPEDFRPRAVPGRFVEMNRLPASQIDRDRALAALPPLIRGYIGQGAWVGDGAVVDAEMNTVDVAIVLKKSWR